MSRSGSTHGMDQHGQWRDGTINFCGQWIRPVPEDVWRKGPGPRYASYFTGLCTEASGILKGASGLAWGCEAGTPKSQDSP